MKIGIAVAALGRPLRGVAFALPSAVLLGLILAAVSSASAERYGAYLYRAGIDGMN